MKIKISFEIDETKLQLDQEKVMALFQLFQTAQLSEEKAEEKTISEEELDKSPPDSPEQESRIPELSEEELLQLQKEDLEA